MRAFADGKIAFMPAWSTKMAPMIESRVSSIADQIAFTSFQLPGREISATAHRPVVRCWGWQTPDESIKEWVSQLASMPPEEPISGIESIVSSTDTIVCPAAQFSFGALDDSKARQMVLLVEKGFVSGQAEELILRGMELRW
jgi:hypothetical protein